ncbi:MAG: rhodanese-like domain-containing protein [Chloroflexota bacterium]
MALVAIITTACNQSGLSSAQSTTPEAQNTGYRTLTIDQFADILANQSDAYTVVNVHIPYAGQIAGTDLLIPYDDVKALTAILRDKNAPIILYCRSGRMSEETSRALIELGFTQVWDVPGGMNAWTASGRQLRQEDSG